MSGDQGPVVAAEGLDPFTIVPKENAWLASFKRRWWMIAIATAAGLLLAGSYLLVSPRTYRAVAMVTVEAPKAGATTSNPLFVQAELAKSSDVMRDALQTIQPGSMSTFSAEREPMDVLRGAMDAEVVPGSDLIAVSVESSSAQDAATLANAVADAFVRQQKVRAQAAANAMTDLAKERDQRQADRNDKERTLLDFKRSNPNFSQADPTKGIVERVEQLKKALTDSQRDGEDARAAVDKARHLTDEAPEMKQLVAAARTKGALADLDQQLQQAQTDLALLEKKQAEQQRVLLPKHPLVVSTQKHIDDLKATLSQQDQKYVAAYRTYLDRSLLTTQKRQEELKVLLAEQNTLAQNSAVKAVEYAKLDGELTKATEALAAADKKLRDASVEGENAAPAVKVIEPARPPGWPARPRAMQVLLIGLSVGLVAGLALALVPRR